MNYVSIIDETLRKTFKPVFLEVVDEFILFIKDKDLIIHNAPFDIGFLNHELKLI